MKRIVVIGGTGNFGARICRRIAGEANTELVVTSRRKENAQTMVNELRGQHANSGISAARLDQHAAEFENDFRLLRPDIVVHTAGPYQGQDYRVATACIAAGCHYIDLADGREFVQGFNVLHEDAKRNDVLLVSGASTLPGLSSVVVDELRKQFSSIKAIEISIAPAHQTPRGASTIAAVLSYCGKPFDVLVGGRWVTRFGWQDLKKQRYADLGHRLSGACNVPDLALLPDYVAGVATVTFHAALEAKWEQLALWSMAWLSRAGLVRKWDAFIPAFQRMSDRLIGLGSDVGGMRITVSGESSSLTPKTLSWVLTARQNHGPEIPCSPALILARKLAADDMSLRGAYACLGLFSMADFADEVSDLDINWSIDGKS